MVTIAFTPTIRDTIARDFRSGVWTPPTLAFIEMLYLRLGGATGGSTTEIEDLASAAFQPIRPSEPDVAPLAAGLRAPQRPDMEPLPVAVWREPQRQEAPAVQPWPLPARREGTTGIPWHPPPAPRHDTSTLDTLVALALSRESSAAALAELRKRVDALPDLVTATLTATGTGFAANPTGTARYALLGDTTVALFLPSLTGTSTATTFTVTGLPTAIQPTQTSWQPVRVTDNGADALGLVRLNAASGTLDLFATVGGGAWTNSGTKTLYPCWLHYALL